VRVADGVVEVEAAEPLGLGVAGRVDHHQQAKPLRRSPERSEARVGEFGAGDVGQHLHALEAQRCGAVFQPGDAGAVRRQRHGAEGDQADWHTGAPWMRAAVRS